MVKLSEEIGRITNILEDAIEEQDWNLVRKIVDDLDIVYDELDKQENGFQHDYD